MIKSKISLFNHSKLRKLNYLDQSLLVPVVFSLRLYIRFLDFLTNKATFRQSIEGFCCKWNNNNNNNNKTENI